MFLRIARTSGLLALFVVACGGSTLNSGGNGDGGSSNTGASSNQGGASSTSGNPGKAGSSSGAGSSALGGSSSVAGSGSVELGCQDVECQPVTSCPPDYTSSQPAGACCEGCVPNPGGAACPKVACPHSVCPLGYVRGDLVGGCCTECVPDALFCNEDSECVIADKPRACCGCPEVITRRQYDADPCWSGPPTPRKIPQSCYPEVVCGAVCSPCPSLQRAVCQNHRCVDSGLK